MADEKKCPNCGRDVFFLSDAGIDPLICQRCGAWLCPLEHNKPCKVCAEKEKQDGR